MSDFRLAGDDNPPAPKPPTSPDSGAEKQADASPTIPMPVAPSIPNIPLPTPPVIPPAKSSGPNAEPKTGAQPHAGEAAARPTPPASTPQISSPQIPSPPAPTSPTSHPAAAAPVVPSPAPPTITPSTPATASTPQVPKPQAAAPSTPVAQAPAAARPATKPSTPTGQSTQAKAPAPRVPSPSIPNTAIPPGMTPHARHDASHSAPQFSHTHRDSSDWTDEITKFAPQAATAVNIGAAVAALAAALLAFLIFSGRTEQVANMGNASTAAAFLNIGAVAAAAGLIVSQWSSRSVGFGLAVVGFVFMAVIPAFIPKYISSVSSLFLGGGFFMLLLGLIKIGLDFAIGSSPKQKTITVRTVPTAPSSAGQNAPQNPNAARNAAAQMPTAPGQSTPHAGAQTVVSHEEIIEDEDQVSALRRVMEGAEPVATWVFRIAAFFTAASLLYLLFGIFAARIGQPNVAPAVTNNIKLAATVFQWSSVLLALSGVWLALDMSYLGLALIALGLGIHFGAPWALFGHVGQTATVAALVASLRVTGFALAMVGLFKQGYEILQWALDLPNRMKQKADVGFAQQAEPAQRRVAKQANMMSPCWQLPFCRETIRKQCPAFLAKKTCWKFGRGCYCDEEMIGRIIRGEELEVIKAPTRLSKTGKAPCGRCHIYLEHQGFKFKLLSPLAFPLTVVIMYFIWPFYSMAFAAFSNSPIWNALNFDKSRITPEAIATKGADSQPVSSISDEQVLYIATILIGVLLGFFVLVYVSKFIEWAIYKAKL